MHKLIQLDVALALALMLGGTLLYVGSENAIDTLQFDLALAQNHLLRPSSGSSSKSDVRVIAVDERSLDRLRDYARVLLAPKWADLIEALAAAEAKAIGFDFVFAYPDKYLAPGWERSFLNALDRHKGRLVLGRSERAVPSTRFQAALGFPAGAETYGAIEVRADADNVHRTVLAHVATRQGKTGQAKLPTLSKLLLAKAGVRHMPERIRLAPEEPHERLPTYSFWDVLECAKSDPAKLQRLFRGAIVLIGTTLPGEDRKLTADRFMRREGRGQDMLAARKAGCAALSGKAPAPSSRLVPSVYLHAAAIDDVLRGAVLTVVAAWVPAGLGAGLAFAIAWFGFRRPPWRTFLLLSVAGLGLHAATSIALEHNIWFPTASLWLGLILAGLIAYLVRYLLVERRRRLLQAAFNHYLTEELVDRIVASDSVPATGGERREITVMFADLSGFTKMSERASPEALMDLTNDYLGAIVDQVHGAGGYVDKFIGDAVMAIWGAPGHDPDHALHATQAALGIVAAVRAKQALADKTGTPGYDVKVALNSGPAVVGNVGAADRLNYSAVGRTVNIAARIEGLLSTHQTPILMGEATAAQIGDRMGLRQMGEASLKGIAQSVKLFAPSGAGDETAASA